MSHPRWKLALDHGSFAGPPGFKIWVQRDLSNLVGYSNPIFDIANILFFPINLHFFGLSLLLEMGFHPFISVVLHSRDGLHAGEEIVGSSILYTPDLFHR